MRTNRSEPVRAIVRQGDVLLIPIDSLPEYLDEAARQGGRLLIAEGEATGHAHAVVEHDARLFSGRYSGDPEVLVVGPGAAGLVHEEHDPIRLAPGLYRIARQREYAPSRGRRGRVPSWRQVAD